MEIRELKGTMLQREIAEKFDISEPRVRAIFAGTIYKAERKIHNWTPEEDAALRDAVAHGLTANEIAAELGKSRGAITTRMGRLELRSESPRAHEQRRMAALRLAAKGQAA